MSAADPGQPRPLPPGTWVRVRAGDPPGHTRAPGYVRGHVGEVVAQHGEHPLPDAVVAGAVQPPLEPVYAVRFAAADLFPGSDARHTVTVNLWQAYLDPVGEGARA